MCPQLYSGKVTVNKILKCCPGAGFRSQRFRNGLVIIPYHSSSTPTFTSFCFRECCIYCFFSCKGIVCRADRFTKQETYI